MVQDYEEETLKTVMNSELQQAIRDAGGQPVRLVDPATNEVYVVIPESAYDCPERLVNVNPALAYDAFAQVAGPHGWDSRNQVGRPTLDQALLQKEWDGIGTMTNKCKKSPSGIHRWSIVYKGERRCIDCSATKPAKMKKGKR